MWKSKDKNQVENSMLFSNAFQFTLKLTCIIPKTPPIKVECPMLDIYAKVPVPKRIKDQYKKCITYVALFTMFRNKSFAMLTLQYVSNWS